MCFSFAFFPDEYDKHPNEVVKNEELTYNNNGGFSLMRTNRRSTDESTSFLFSWMPQQLSFIALTLSLVFFLNYLFVIQSIFAPNMVRVVRCKVPAGANDDDDDDQESDSEIDSDCRISTKKSSKLCQLASSTQCQLTNVPRTSVDNDIDDDDNDDVDNVDDHCVTVHNNSTWNDVQSADDSAQLALNVATTLIKCCRLHPRTTETASVKLIDKAISPQLESQQRSIVTTNFNNDNTTTLSPNNILNNTNTILNYSKSTCVHSRHLNRTYEKNNNDDDDETETEDEGEYANGTINLTNAFIALYTTNSDNIKLNNNNICSDKFSLENDSCIRHNSIECSDEWHQQQQHKQQHYDNLNSRSCSGATLVRCYR